MGNAAVGRPLFGYRSGNGDGQRHDTDEPQLIIETRLTDSSQRLPPETPCVQCDSEHA
jgi:hypothetical protein